MLDFIKSDGGRAKEYGRTLKQSDCVIRSIAIASDDSYRATLTDICALAVELGSVPTEQWLYSKYLERRGFIKLGTPRDGTGRKIRLRDLDGIGSKVVNVSGHLTAVVDGEVRDIWDCRSKCCNSVWQLAVGITMEAADDLLIKLKGMPTSKRSRICKGLKV